MGYVAAAVVFTWPLALQLGTHLTGDPAGDTGVYVWNQWVFSHEAIVQHHNPLTTGRILSLSYRVDLSQHNYTAFLNVLAMPLMPWLGVVATFNVVFLEATVLTALMTYVLVRRTTAATPLEAWLAGLLFAWSPVLVARSTGHFSLVAAAPLPAFIVCLLAAGRTHRPRDAALAGLCMAWAGFCDAYYTVYCAMIAAGYVLSRVLQVVARADRGPVRLRWDLDLMIVVAAGLVVGLLVGRGGDMEIFGVVVRVRGLYTPVLVLTLLLLLRVALHLRPRVVPLWPITGTAVRAAAAGVFACAAPLSPVLYGLGERAIDGRLVLPATWWRSSPSGVDLLAFFAPNPNHPLVRTFLYDPQSVVPVTFVETTAALSLVAVGIVAWAVMHARYRPGAGWTWLTVGFAALALGPFIHLGGVNTYVPGPWALLRYVPVFSTARTPTRFAVVVALGLAVVFAGALARLGERWPRRRTALALTAGLAIIVELWPAPRLLYPATTSPVYDIVAADRRPVRILELPFGVRDGVSSTGNFSARYEFDQTRHEKRLAGGYLSRISSRRVQQMRSDYPMLDALITLSEGTALSPDRFAAVIETGPRFIAKVQLGYVVIHYGAVSSDLVQFAVRAFGLREVARDGTTVLYVPTRTP